MKQVMRAMGRRGTVTLATLWLTGILLAAAPIALAHDTGWAWSESKAKQTVMKKATIRFPPLERASLEEELRTSRAYYRVLELVGFGEGSEYAVIYHDLAHRYGLALRTVQSGLRIDEADCTGSGSAARRNQFKRFRCSVTSDVLEIPSVVIVPSETGGLPAVVEGRPRRIGPFQARLNVQVSGKSRISYLQIDS
jgi:hypothetical protein